MPQGNKTVCRSKVLKNYRVLLLKVEGNSTRDSNQSLYNVRNLNESLSLAISMIKERVLIGQMI